ncbi:sugar ABC transporter substrate-binding protein [Paraglaciecola aquimarina]|uniref:Sugar ABC transporter substrate-binding protein n=1 Tax=Paraglaciecola aquimarina TaxID=1235557 RepID=A0ABU3SY55_9ALTE|nr:sugar ABC transporter substrate-binding protein [Paraglaciecola aquimarina]MDU0354941.1 sugar ABC transporter substrate-binding protein [Paraglaciecola aquimarina]
MNIRSKMRGVVSVVAVFILSSIASTAFAEKIRIGLAVDQLFESRVAENNAIKVAAQKLGFEVIEVVADGDAQTQNAQIQSLVVQRVDAILVCAVDQNTIERALMRAKRARIPVIAYDRALPDSRSVAAFVGPDSISDGREAGRHMAEQLKGATGKVQVLELLGALNDQNGIDRSKGFRQAMKALPDVEVISVPTDWDSAKALAATENAFQANPNIKGVFAATDTQIPAIETVLSNLNKKHRVGEEEHIVVTGVNGSNDGYTATKSGFADGIVVMDLTRIGEKAVQLAATLIDGGSVDRHNVVYRQVLFSQEYC